jgi:hypothetical protein
MSREELTTHLMGPWQFDQQDLEANRSGQLSARQMEVVRANQKALESFGTFNGRIVLIAVLVFALVGVLMLMLLARSGNLPIPPVALVLIGAVLVLALVVLILTNRRTGRSIEAAKPITVELLNVIGPAKFISGGGAKYGFWHGVEVGGVEFSVVNGETRQKAFVEGESYRIFYTKIPNFRGNNLWSAEAI